VLKYQLSPATAAGGEAL